MKLIAFLAALASASSHPTKATVPAAPQRRAQGTLRRNRATGAPPRKLNDDLPLNGPVMTLLNRPREVFSQLFSTATGAGVPTAQTMQQSVGDVVDRTRNVADTSFDTLEQLATGVAQRSRGLIDRATARAADIVDHTVALGSNSLGASVDAARGLQGEAKKMAGQAAGVAQNAVKASEVALASTLDRFSTGVGRAVPIVDDNYRLAGLLSTPINSLMGITNPLFA